MKMEQVILENFGIYTRKVFQFNQSPLIVIYGTNESGKTTALNGLRQAIFGFRPRTTYLTGQTMSATVSGRMHDGCRLEFTRRKGRPDELLGTLDSAKLNAGEIRKLLCDLDLESYEQLFGFSQDELRRGQDALKSIRLSEALAGGSLNGINALERLRGELNESLSELYKSRGSTSKINLKLAEIRRSQEALRGTDVLPAEIEDLRAELRDAHRNSEELRSEQVQVNRDHREAQMKLAALPKFVALLTAQSQLDDIDVPAEIDASFLAQWGDYAEQRKSLALSVSTEKEALAATKEQLRSLGGNSLLLDDELKIEQLGHQATEVSAMRDRLSALREAHKVAGDAVDHLLESLQLAQVDESVMAFSISVPKRQELESLSSQYVALGTELVETKARLQAAQESSEAQSAADDDLPPDNLHEIAQRVRQLVEAEQHALLQARKLDEGLSNPAYRELVQRISELLPADIELDPHWKIPSDETVADFQRRSAELILVKQQTQAELKKLRTADQNPGADEEPLGSDAALQVLATAERVSQERDAIICEWLDELSQPLLAASISVEQQLQRLSELKRLGEESDKTRAELLECTEVLAAATQRRQLLEQSSERIRLLEVELTAIQERENELTSGWIKLWAELPFSPVAMDKMLLWARDFSQWRTMAERLSGWRRDLHIARGLARSAKGHVLDLWPTNVPEDIAIDVLREKVQRWQKTTQDLEREAERRRAAKASIDRLVAKAAELEKSRHQLREAHQAWLKQLPVTDQWPIEKTGELINALSRLKREHLALQDARQQIAAIETTLEQFGQAVAELAKHLKTEVDVRQPEHLANAWLESLQELRSERTQRIKLISQIEHRSLRLQESSARLQQVDARLAALCAASTSGNVADVTQLVERVRLAESLRSQISELNASLASYCGPDRLPEFLQSLAAGNNADLEFEISECATRLQQLEQLRKETDQRIGSLQQRIEHLANSQESLRNMQALQNQRGDLVELAQRWVVERLAQELLSRTIERFASENEPALLRLTRQYLAQLTGGRYTSVEHDKSGKGEFVIRNAQAEAFAPDRLSTGTREQLYLAIRMAFVTYHAAEHEPLPVLMDDCFVNFDDQRTSLALEAIAAWDDSLQTIILSCHSRVVRLLADIAPETPVIHLDRELTLPAEVLAGDLLTLS